MPVYLNALTGKGVHVVTVNDYLATRDSEQMGRLYNFLGLSTGLIVANLDFNQRKEAMRVILHMVQIMSLVLTIYAITW